MMAVVWFIDIVVIVVKILGGHTRVNPVLRVGMWIAMLCVVTLGVVAVGALFVLLERGLSA
ncbi:hypothetical protein ACFWUP_02155 [Nocardia sp. NPDC058658]|uniref:hypothetical protein n=1 Tax=Nocardia sp. NPDC058658 TaxID=3346580 RepID=UPI00365AEAB8